MLSELLGQLDLRINPANLISTTAPMTFTLSEQFETWHSTLIWSRTVVNHIGELFDCESLVQFPLFTGIKL
jgi:hypothetical protein